MTAKRPAEAFLVDLPDDDDELFKVDETIRPGEYVKIKNALASRVTKGAVYRVKTIGTKYVELEPVMGGRGVKAEPYMIERTEAPADIPTEPLYVGALVTVAGRSWKEPADRLWFVSKVANDGSATLYPLGGSATGAHYGKVPRGYITIVDPSRVTVAPE
jgi:hypothetical protein